MADPNRCIGRSVGNAELAAVVGGGAGQSPLHTHSSADDRRTGLSIENVAGDGLLCNSRRNDRKHAQDEKKFQNLHQLFICQFP